MLVHHITHRASQKNSKKKGEHDTEPIHSDFQDVIDLNICIQRGLFDSTSIIIYLITCKLSYSSLPHIHSHSYPAITTESSLNSVYLLTENVRLHNPPTPFLPPKLQNSNTPAAQPPHLVLQLSHLITPTKKTLSKSPSPLCPSHSQASPLFLPSPPSPHLESAPHVCLTCSSLPLPLRRDFCFFLNSTFSLRSSLTTSGTSAGN